VVGGNGSTQCWCGGAILGRSATSAVRVVLEALHRSCTEVQLVGTVEQLAWVRPKMLAHPKSMQARLVPWDTCQDSHVVIIVGRVVILVCTDFMENTVGRGCTVIVI